MFKTIALEVCVAFGLMCSSGCIVVESLNVQKSLLRGTGDSGVTAVLENQDEEKVAEVVDGVISICQDVLEFLDSGSIAELTRSELKRALLDVVPDGSADFVNDIMSLVSMARIDVDGKIGTRNVKRIRASVIGVIRGADEYSVEDRD